MRLTWARAGNASSISMSRLETLNIVACIA
jgi:hypothetical protein